MSSIRSRIGGWISRNWGLPSVDSYTDALMKSGRVKVAVDVGCGESSILSKYRPNIVTIGIDAFTIEAAKKNNVHDHYVVADVINLSAEDLLDRVWEVAGTREVDLVTAYGLIEHLPKKAGWTLLEKCEQLTRNFVLMETPNGFVEQGPEYGNPYQRHLSGWFPHDFASLGYKVHGTSGTKYVRGYMGEPRIRIPGLITFDTLFFSRLLISNHFPQHAFNIVAIKDKDGVSARYQSYSDPKRG